MATQNNAVKPSAGNRFVNWCKNLGPNLVSSFREMAAELKKVAWPSKKEMLNYTLVVLGFMVVMGTNIITTFSKVSGSSVIWSAIISPYCHQV